MKGLRSIAVTGAAGRIGRAICTEASRNGINVVGIDAILHAEVIQADVRDTNRLSRLFEGVDCVFHCAGLHAPHVGLQPEDNSLHWLKNNRRTDNGTQAEIIVSNAMGAPVSCQWKGCWQRAA
jgi:nucleoside-diphosphate-sugar epimerase